MDYLSPYPELVKLFELNDKKIQTTILEKIISQPTESDSVGFVYGFTKSCDKNTRYNFYLKLGRTVRDPNKRIEEWVGEQVFSIKSIYNKKFERLVHLFFKFANVKRDNEKKIGSKEIEWFKFENSYHMDKHFVIARVNEINSLIDDLHLESISNDEKNEKNDKKINESNNIPNDISNNIPNNIIENYVEDKININNCSQIDLETINGISSILSGKIVKFRPYSNLDEIKLKVSGIGPVKLEEIKKTCVV